MAGRRSADHRTPRRNHITGLRLWLETTPASFGIEDYDRWVADTKPDNEQRAMFVRGRAISKSLRLGWGELLAVARGEVTIEAAGQKRARAQKTKERGPHDLVSLQDVVELMSTTADRAARATHKPAFPRPALLSSRRRFWVLADVLAYLAGDDVPHRQENELRDQYFDLRDMQDVTGLTAIKLEHGAEGFPAPAARVGGRLLWLRSEVEPALSDGRRFRSDMDDRHAST